MVDYREILRLDYLGYIKKDIASSVHSSRNTVSEVLTLAGNLHVCWPLDDNSPSKNDRKDPRIIAGLVKDGRYFYSYMPTGVYAELRNASNRRFVLVEEL